MQFIWSDKEYWERYKKGAKIELKFYIPSLIICGLFWYLFFKEELNYIYLFSLSFFSSLSIFTFISIFKEFPNTAIHSSFSQKAKKIMYLFQFVISVIILFFAIYVAFKR